MWVYQEKPFETVPEGIVGFVYLIVNETNQRFYIGKKLFTKAGYKQVKGKRKKVRKESDWKSYYGSNKELNEDVRRLGGECFRREILHLCTTKGECSYKEAEEQFLRKCLEVDNCYNFQIRLRVVRNHLPKRIL